MGVRDYDKLFSNFDFTPTTDFTVAQGNKQPEIDKPSHFTPVTVEERQYKSAEELLEMDKEETTSDVVPTEPSEEIDTAFPSKYSGLKEFYSAIGDSVKTKEAKYALLAQMGLESGWGVKSAGSKHYNYGNITTGSSWKGDYFRGKDKDASGNVITQKFRRYGSAEEFYKDYSNLIKNLYPDAYEQLTADKFDIDKFSYGLRNGRVGMYAESPEYEDSLRTVYESVLETMTPRETTKIRKSGGILYNV
jgi:flagellum-specific peptidoglycan hydrolase FlgJ